MRVFTARELATYGLTPSVVAAQVGAGLLVPTSPGRWRCADPEGWRSAFARAVSAAGPRAVVVGRSAAAVHGLDGFVPGDEGFTGLVEVAVPRGRHARLGVQRLDARAHDVVEIDGVRVLAAASALAGLGRSTRADLVERAMESALRRRLTTEQALRSPALTHRRRGGAVLREVMARRPVGAPPTGSDAETRFLQVVRAGGLPVPDRQVEIVANGTAFHADFGWRDHGVATEVDSRRWHGATAAERDARRQNEITVCGWMVIRVTWHDVVFTPDWVVDLVARALEAAVLRGRQRPWAR
ncbi:MAG TPA: DUF559 domain-containing protein [Acidimicrobiales bacterium]|nr:DUF559 domain-containing protein [Acidimicrobiales bacterium]